MNNLHPPQFARGEYSSLIPLAAAEYHVEYRRLDDRLRELVKFRDAAQDNEYSRLQVVGGEIADLMRSQAEKVRGRDRLLNLQACASQLTHLCKYLVPNRPRIEAVKREVVDAYSTAAVDEFIRDWAKVDPTPKGHDADALATDVVEAQAALDAHRLIAPTCFVNQQVPVRFRSIGIRNPDDAADVVQAAHGIVNQFVRDWRERASVFGMPVSVDGTMIQSMESDRRKPMEQAYRLLKLEPGRRGVYLPFDGQTGRPCAYDDPRLFPVPPRPQF